MGRQIVKKIAPSPIVRLLNATLYREQPKSDGSLSSAPLFSSTNLDIWPRYASTEYWAVVGPAGSGKTTFLELLRGDYLCEPPLARSYPFLPQVGSGNKRIYDVRILRNRDVSKAIRYTGFGGKGTNLSGIETRGSYMAARYESRHEAEDFTLRDYLLGITKANPSDNQRSLMAQRADNVRLKKVTQALQLESLLDLPASVLSNGQTRRARIAKACMEFPLLLLLDEPFLGIDPIQRRILSPALWSLSRRSGPNMLLALGNDEPPPRWVTHLICLDNCQIQFSGPKHVVYEKALAAGYPLATNGIKRSLWRGGSGPNDELDTLQEVTLLQPADTSTEAPHHNQPTAYGDELMEDAGKASSARRQPNFTSRWNIQRDIIESLEIGEPIIEMKGVQVNYGPLVALGNWQDPGQEAAGLHWTIRRGERWGIYGSNGSGKTTILSLVNSDHPKSYSQSISYFGRPRLPDQGQAGISIFDLQSRIMQASPEVHAFFPKHLSLRATIENAWADTFLSKPKLTHQIDSTVDGALRWFERELNPRCVSEDPLLVLSKQPGSGRKAQTRIDLYHERSLDWADKIALREVSFAAQRVALFLRAIIKKPDLVILDEAFSGMDKSTRIKCMMFLAYGQTRSLMPASHGQEFDLQHVDQWSKYVTPLVDADLVKLGPFESRQALVVVSHDQAEVPPLVDQYIFLEEPGSGKPPRFGSIPGADDYRSNQRASWWSKMWTPSVAATNKDKFNRSYAQISKT